jgi:hypothetical protein
MQYGHHQTNTQTSQRSRGTKRYSSGQTDRRTSSKHLMSMDLSAEDSGIAPTPRWPLDPVWNQNTQYFQHFELFRGGDESAAVLLLTVRALQYNIELYDQRRKTE